MRRDAMQALWRRFALASLVALACGTVGAERVLLQVEEFDGPWRRQTNIPGYLGKSFCTSNARGVAKTVMMKTARLREAGRYAVWMRAFSSANSRRALQVAVDGQKLAVTHGQRRRRWSWQRAGEVELAAGPVEIVIHDADVGFECADAVLLTDRKDDDPMAEERNWSLYPDGLRDRANALRFNIDAILALTRGRKAPATKAQWDSRKAKVARELRRALGLDPWPKKSPLNARVTGRTERGGYTIENVVFESQPRFYVTANVYVPKGGKRPLPAVIVTAGHAMREGKNYDMYRTVQLSLCRMGFVVLAYDPIGQGERRRRGNGHTVGYAALMTGHLNIGYMVWDTIRVVDYLASRRDVDPERIGLTGNSGGGLNTMYAFPVEPRLAAAASYGFACSYYAWVKDGGNHCICSHLPASARGFEQFEVIGTNAPRPFLAGNGAEDRIFPKAGFLSTMRRAKAIYALCGAEERIAQRLASVGHGFFPPLRQSCYGWMCRWLQGQGDGSPIAEPDVKLEPWQAKHLRCFKDDAKWPKDARTYVDLVRAEAGRLVAGYPPVPSDQASQAAWARRLRERLWHTLGGRPTFHPKAKALGSFAWRGHTVERLAIQTERRLEVPALFLRPKRAREPMPVVVFLDDGGKVAARSSPVVRGLLKRGTAVLAMDPRGTGEGAVHDNHCASDSVVLGRPVLAQMAWDVLCAARVLADRGDVDSRRIGVYGRGSVGLVATLAAALSDDLSAVVSEGAPASFAKLIADPLPQPLWAYATNILTAADIPQLVALCAPRPFLWANAVGIRRRPVPEGELRMLAAPARGSYRAAGAASALVACLDAQPADRVVALFEAAFGR